MRPQLFLQKMHRVARARPVFFALAGGAVALFALYLFVRIDAVAHVEDIMPSPSAHTEPQDGPGHQELAALQNLPLRTPRDRIAELPHEMKDGVKEFRLEAQEFRWEYAQGKWVHVWGYNGQIPGPTIRVSEGEKVRVVVKNSLPDATTVHWHGVDVPWQADGTPQITQEPIQSGTEFVYEFAALPSGTHFYHTHGKSHATSAQQLDMGLSGPLIIEPKKETAPHDREFIAMLDEWDILPGGANAALTHVHGAGETGAVPEYNTFTINGRVFPYTDVLKVRENERVLIRVVNAGTSAFHPMHLHGHNFEVVAIDGNALAPLAREVRNTFTLHPGETADFLVRTTNPGPWAFHCHHVHHAAAGMTMLFQYEGFEPVVPLAQAVEEEHPGQGHDMSLRPPVEIGGGFSLGGSSEGVTATQAEKLNKGVVEEETMRSVVKFFVISFLILVTAVLFWPKKPAPHIAISATPPSPTSAPTTPPGVIQPQEPPKKT